MTNKIALAILVAAVLCLTSAGNALAEITIGDNSFELQSMSGGIYNYIESPWFSSVTGPWASYEGQYGVTNVPDGTQYGTPSNDDLYQDLAATYVNGETYTLTAHASARTGGAGGDPDDWEIALYKSSTELASTSGTFSLVNGVWQEISVQYTATAADDGDAIRIYFGSSGGYKFVLDDVHLNGPPEVDAVIDESNQTTLVVEAGTTDSYTIALASAPTANVTITATPGDSEIDIGNGAGVAKNLIFTPSDWQAKTVNATAFDDTVYEGGPGGTPHITSITHSAQQSGGGGEYDGITISTVEVSVIDDELGCGDWGYLATDLNRDCYVNLVDFAQLALNYMDGSYLLYYGPIGYWKLDEVTGIIAADSSGNGRDGALVNMEDGDWVAAVERPGNALDFDGVDEYVEIAGYKGVTGLSSRTVAAWIKTTTTGEIITWGTNSPGEKWIFRVQDDIGTAGAIRVEVNGGRIVGNTDVRDDAWHHVAAVLEYDGSPDVSEVKLYVNGVEETVYSDVSPGPVNTASGANVKIGVFIGNDRYFNGQIDDVRIYDRALSSSEIYDLAN